MTIIDDCDSLTNSIAEEDEEEEGGVRAPYSRSISLPPRDPALTTPQRKLSESDARGAGLTGLFFQRLLASEEGAGEQYRSSSSLASLASQDSARSEGAGSSLLATWALPAQGSLALSLPRTFWHGRRAGGAGRRRRLSAFDFFEALVEGLALPLGHHLRGAPLLQCDNSVAPRACERL